MSRLLVCFILAILCACSGANTSAPLPPTPAAPVGSTAPTVDGFPVAIHEYQLPNQDPRNPVVGPDGLIWLSAGQLQMDRVAGDGRLSVFTTSAPSGETWTGFFSSISFAGSIYTQYLAPESASMPELEGLFLARVATTGAITPEIALIATDTDVPFGPMATDASGGLWVYVADYGAAGRLTRFVSNGNQLTVTAGCSVFGDVDTLAYGPDGNLYPAASAVGTPTIYKVSPTCGILGTFTPPVPSRIASMVFGSDGALWMIFRSATNVIGHLTTSGTYTELHVPFAGSALSAITKGSDGAVWFTDAGTNAIGRVTTTGAFSEFHVPTPHAFKGGSGGIVSCPTKCENAHGRIWFSEDAASKIGKLEF